MRHMKTEDLQAVILAAGRGSRLNPITVKRSKAMLPILGKPIVERVMENIWHTGIKEFIVVVSPNDSEIMEHFHREWELKAQIKFVIQKQRLGMADALSCVASLIRGGFILSACDNLVSVEHIYDLLAKFFEDKNSSAVLSLMRVPKSYISKTGIVKIENGFIRRIVEKPKLEEAPSDIASLPLYVFKPEILDYLPEVQPSIRGEYELQEAIQILIERDGNITGAFTKERLNLTSPKDLLFINRHYLISGHDKPQLAPHTVGRFTQLITPLRIEEGTTIGENCKIGPNVYIEKNCSIGKDVRIEDAVVLSGTVIPDGAFVENKVLS